jgi:hypothetical protein
MGPSPADVTTLLSEHRKGDEEATRQLLPLAYGELREPPAGRRRCGAVLTEPTVTQEPRRDRGGLPTGHRNPEYRRTGKRLEQLRKQLKGPCCEDRRSTLRQIRKHERLLKRTPYYRTERKHPCKVKYVRFADDFLIKALPFHSIQARQVGLGIQRRQRKRANAQHVLTTLNAIAHNALVWCRGWMAKSEPKRERSGFLRS